MKKKRLKFILYAVFIMNLIIAIGYYSYYVYHLNRSEKMNSALKEVVLNTKETELHNKADEIISKSESNKKVDSNDTDISGLLDFDELKETNEDIYAWVEIPDTEISYPILQHETEDSYYLMHNLDLSYGYPGCVFTESINKKDFTDCITILYAHNMKNGSMFGTLHKFESESYFSEHPYIYTYTEEKMHVYKIVAAVNWTSVKISHDYDVSADSAKEEFYTDLINTEGGQFREANVQKEDNLLVLSTCTKGEKENRYIVVAVQLQ